MGFTWEKYAAGRCLVGKDTNDSDFDTLGETGGSKYLQAHEHDVRGTTSGTFEAMFITNSGGSALPATTSGYAFTSSYAKAQSTGSGNSGNLQPYIVVNIWKRVS